MHRNRQPLRILLSGPAANELAPSLEGQETLSMVLADDSRRTGLDSSVDVALHGRVAIRSRAGSRHGATMKPAPLAGVTKRRPVPVRADVS